jgi:isoleucyl-tRNA synthetase
LRDDINKLLELARNNKLVGASLDAAAYVYAPDDIVRAMLGGLDGGKGLVYPPVTTNGVDDLRTVLMLSQVNLVDSEGAVAEACEEQYVLSPVQ